MNVNYTRPVITSMTPYEELPTMLRVDDLITILRISRNRAYEFANSAEACAVRFGKTIRIPKTSIRKYLLSN